MCIPAMHSWIFDSKILHSFLTTKPLMSEKHFEKSDLSHTIPHDQFLKAPPKYKTLFESILLPTTCQQKSYPQNYMKI